LLIASAGCQTAYLVKSSDLDRLTATDAPPPLIPARRADGTSVVLRTSLLTDPIKLHFARADTLQRSGNYERAAEELRACEHLLDDGTEAEWTQLQAAINALEYGGGATVSVPSLRVAQRRGMPPPTASGEVHVEVVNPKKPTVSTLAIVGGVLAVASVPLGFGVAFSRAGGGDGGSAVAGMATGIVFGVSGVALLLASAGVAIADRHGAEADAASFADQPRLLTAGQLERETRHARRMTIGGGVSLALSVALAVAGTVMFLETPYTPLPNGGREIDFGVQVTGAVFMGLGYGGFIPSLAVFWSGLHQWRRLRGVRHEGGATTSLRSVTPAPWIRRDGGGLALSAAF
jgi:hypothetical protein